MLDEAVGFFNSDSLRASGWVLPPFSASLAILPCCEADFSPNYEDESARIETPVGVEEDGSRTDSAGISLFMLF